MIDEELFGLCREVYRRTGWGGTDFDYFKINKDAIWEIVPSKRCGYGEQEWQIAQTVTIYPLYTSDYLLEKLDKHEIRTRSFNGSSYTEQFSTRIEKHSNTLRKALLKLVIALDGAGVKL